MSTNTRAPERYRLSTDKADVLFHLRWSCYRRLGARLQLSFLICGVCRDMCDGMGGIRRGDCGDCFGDGFLLCDLSFCHFGLLLISWVENKK